MKCNKYIQLLVSICLLFAVNLVTYALMKIDQKNSNVFDIEMLHSGLGVPWGMAFISSNELLFSQRNGKIGLLDLQKKQVIWIKNAPHVYHNGQAGLLDIAVADNYERTGWIYFTYSKQRNNQSATTLARAKLASNSLYNWQDLLVSQSFEAGSQHYGSRIAFDGNGHVFFSIGDRGKRPNAQNLSNHAGTILRLNLDGSTPDDNPFITKKNVLPEIWSYGHRNPQGLVYDKMSQRLWSIEHGPRGGDEINLIIAGKNYGWPVISYGKEYWGPVKVGEGTHKAGMEQPVKSYVPSIAPSSLLIYSGRAFPQWRGNLFAGALKLRHLNRITLDINGQAIGEQRYLQALDERIRCVIEGPEGWIYLSTDSGKILRLKPRIKTDVSV